MQIDMYQTTFTFHQLTMMIVCCWMVRGEVVAMKDPYIKGMSLNKSLM